MRKIMGGMAVALGLLLVAVACGAGAIGVGMQGAGQGALPDPTWTVGQPSGEPLEAAPAAQGPPSAIPVGVVRVGIEVYPGVYRTTASAPYCRWKRLSGLSGDLSEILAGDMVRPETQVTVEIRATDVGFDSTEGCAPWVRVR